MIVTRAEANRSLLRASVAMAIVLTGLCLLVITATPHPDYLALAVLVAVGGGAAWRFRQKRFDSDLQIEYRFDSQGFTTRQDHAYVVSVPWGEMRGVQERRAAFVFDCYPVTVTVEKRAFSTSGVTALRHLLTEKLSGAARIGHE